MTAHQLELQAYLFRSIMQSAISEKMNYASEMVMLKTEADRLKRSFCPLRSTSVVPPQHCGKSSTYWIAVSMVQIIV